MTSEWILETLKQKLSKKRDAAVESSRVELDPKVSVIFTAEALVLTDIVLAIIDVQTISTDTPRK